MKKLVNRDNANGQNKWLRYAKLLVVGYAVLDFVLTLIRMNRFAEQALAEDIQIDRQIVKMVDPCLLLVVATGFWLGRKWGYLLSFAASALLLYRGLIKWEAIALAQFPEVPTLSWSVLTWWWLYGGAKWDFARLILAAIVLAYAAMSLLLDSGFHDGLGRKGALSK